MTAIHRFALISVVSAMLAPPSVGAAVGGTMLLISPRSRAVLCDFDEACTAGTCASAPERSCGAVADCPRCIVVENQDIALCEPDSLGAGATACRWSLFFDGTRAGLNAPIRALEMLPDGSLLLRSAADNAIPDISGANRRDLVRFIPTDEAGRPGAVGLPYHRGEWLVFLDGRAVEANSGARLIEAIALLPNSCRDVNGDGVVSFQECDLLFTPTAAGTLAGLDLQIEDIVRCRPTSLSAGATIEACDYAMFYEASEVNDSDPHDEIAERAPGSWVTGGNNAFAVRGFDPATFAAEIFFSAGNDATLPAHQPSRDLLRHSGTVGPWGWCSDDAARRCLGASDCGPGAVCNHVANPSTVLETQLWFDGSQAIGGEMIDAIAIVPDTDGDGVPDPRDNCPHLANPAVCSATDLPCRNDLDCGADAYCHQPDSDGDGVGDGCDRCAERDDAECFCGDQVTDFPSEQCDLGAPALGGHNGLEYSPCTADCRVIGRCTRSGETCTEASECPAFALGEGCCGNGQVDVPPDLGSDAVDEQCDDANAVGDDGCNNQCRIVVDSVPLPQECEGLIGPRIVPTFVRTLRFQKQRRQVPADAEPDNYSKWSTRGEFSLVPGILFRPDVQSAEIIFNQGESRCDAGERAGELCSGVDDCPAGRCSGTLYRATLPPGSFVQAGLRHDRPRWAFKDRNGTIAGAPAWTKGRFSQRLATIRRPLNEVRFMLQGRGDRLEPQLTLHLDPNALGGPPTRVRQTIVIGDLCTTQSLVCEGNRAGTTLQCFSRVE